MSNSSGNHTRISIFSLLVIFILSLSAIAFPAEVTTSGAGTTPGDDNNSHQVFLPFVVQKYDAGLEKVVKDAVGRHYSAEEGYNPQISKLDSDGDWGLAIINLGVSMADQSSGGDSVFAVAYRENGQWKAVMSGDSEWSNWVSQAPDSVMDRSLREYLLDQYAVEIPGVYVAGSLPDLKLPWLPKDNPRSISGYLYNEGTHVNSDAYGMDWGLVNNDVAAVASGTVVDWRCDLPNVRDDSKGYGNYVQMNIGDGILALYAHLQSCSVSMGQWYTRSG